MDDLELVKMRLSRMPVGDLVELAEASGVPYGTLWNIWKRETKSPRYPTVKKLADHFKGSTFCQKAGTCERNPLNRK